MGSGTHRPVPLQSLLAMSPEKRKLAAQEVQPTEPLPEEQPKEKPHTLEEFSYEFFRCPLRPPPGPASPLVFPEVHREAMEAGAVSTWPLRSKRRAGRGLGSPSTVHTWAEKA